MALSVSNLYLKTSRMTLVNEYRAPRIIRETFIKSFVKIKIVLNLNGRKNDSEINYSAPYFRNAVSGRDG